jgi:Ni,Fe-hydrogenase I cytochrome b subunit
MSTTSASPAERPAAELGSGTILVWDLPVRVLHWLIVLCFAGAYLTAESESSRLVHVTLGYTMAGLVVFRLVWGAVGHPIRALLEPRAVAAYIGGMLRGRSAHHTGHNPGAPSPSSRCSDCARGQHVRLGHLPGRRGQMAG